jgi:hypothetical protein
MKYNRIYLSNCLLILILITLGCKSHPNEETFIMEVNSLKVPCEDIALRSCLQVRYNSEQDWQLFYSEINGFDYEEGNLYTLKITKRERDKENRPMDVSAYTYHLKSVMKKTKDNSILLNDIWGLKSIWNGEEELEINNKSLNKGNPMLEINTRTMKFSGHDGCNTFSGTIDKVNQSELVFGNAITSLMNCENMEIPDQVLKNLNRVRSYKLEELQLVLYENELPLLKYQKID